MSEDQVDPDSPGDLTRIEKHQYSSSKRRIMKWIIIIFVVICLFALLGPATLSQAHLDRDHANWNERPAVLPIEDVEGAIEDLVVGQEVSSSIASGSYDEAIRDKKDLIERIDNSFKKFQCFPIDPLFHYYYNKTMYFATYDEVLIPSCDNGLDLKWSGDRENIAVWNKRRTVSEWAFHALQPNENVLYYRPGVYNHAELIIISRLIAANGRVYVLGYEQGRSCFEMTKTLNEALSNVQFIVASELPNVGYLNALIAHESIYKGGPLSAFPVPAFSKMLLFCEDGTAMANSFPRLKVEKVLLRDMPCGGAVFTTVEGRGFFSFLPAGVLKQRRTLPKFPSNFSILVEYEKFKLQQKQRIATELAVLQKYADSGICRNAKQTAEGVTTVYGHLLFGASLEEVQGWDSQRQSVEWMRQGKKGNLYYEMSEPNLLVVLELSFLLETNTLFVVCAKYCARIQSQQRSNIRLLTISDSVAALNAAAIVTDNRALIRESIAKGFLQRGALLAFIAGEDGLVLLRQLFVMHHLRQVVLPKQRGHCLGYTYLHQFWNSEQPNGFYDVSPSKLGFVAYAFWGGDPHKVPQRKKFLMQQMASGTVELKIVGPTAFRSFQVEGSPIHPVFYLLSTGHQSDYFRTYVMHHYGGIYLDIKHIHIDLNDYFEKLQSSDSILVTGFPDHGKGACDPRESPPACWIAQSMHKRLMANIQFAAKKGTAVTAEWLRLVNLNLDASYQQLKRNPTQVDRQSRGAHMLRKDGTRFISRYPVEWSQIAGEQLIRVEFKYLDNFDLTMPKAITEDYRIA